MYKYGFNKNNIRISEKCLRKFINIVNFYKYPTGIGLDENGYFSLDLKNKNYFISFSFQSELHLCIYNFKKDFTTKIIKPEDFFKNIDSDIYSDFFDKKSDFINIDDKYFFKKNKQDLINKKYSFITVNSIYTLENKIGTFNEKATKTVETEDFFKNVNSDIYSDFFDKKKYFMMESHSNFIENHLEKILPKNYKGLFFKYYNVEFTYW